MAEALEQPVAATDVRSGFIFLVALSAAVLVRMNANAALAQEPQTVPARLDPLFVEEVLASSAERFPQVLESLAQRRVASGQALASEGAFDLVFSADGFSRATGFWDGSVIEGKATQALRPLGAQVFGSYRISDGRFPIYEDINFTNQLGELKVGVLFSLLRDRQIDERRFAVADAAMALEQADLGLTLTRIGVQYRALSAYWRWVTAGRRLEVYENLLALAEARMRGLEEEVRLGARARIFLTENRQNITRRQILVAQSRQDFISAANALSLYLRGPEGEPIVPDPGRLPPTPSTLPGAENGDLDAATLDAALLAMSRRPDLRAIATDIERARLRLALDKNALKPRLDLRYEVSRDFGDIGEGGISRDSTDNIVGLKLVAPLQRRDARGRVRAAEAQLEALQERRRGFRDQLEVELRNIVVDLNVSRQLRALAAQEVEQSEIMQQAERDRFEDGASDFFLVNIREETAADARVRYWLTDLNARLAEANFGAATVDIERLGLEGQLSE